MSYLLLFLEAVFSSGQSLTSKLFAKQGGDSLTFNLNKAAGGCLMFLLLALLAGPSLHLPTVIYGTIYGGLLCLAMHTGFKALATGPMAPTSIIAAFSSVIPFLVGIVFWKEELSLFKFLGLGLTVASIVLINARKEKGFSLRWLVYTFTTMVANGICSVIQKLHQTDFPGLYRNEFMFFSFVAVFIVMLGIRVVKKGPAPKGNFCLLGVLSGVSNGLMNYTVLYLSAAENASVLFPAVSVINIIAVWLVSMLVFKERLRLVQAIGVVVGVVSVVLLKL